MITTDHPTILVVDDDPQFRTAVTDALEMADYAVIQANDGEQALNQLQTHDVALILADVAMPGLNGYQLLHRVRQREQWLAIPFIFLTGRSLDSDIHYGKELGVDDYLTKPLDPDALLATVRGKLRRAQQWQRATSYTTLPHATVPLIWGSLRIDRNQHRVWLNNRPVSLSAREFQILTCLVEAQGDVVAPQALIQVTHDLTLSYSEASDLLRPFIHTLRRKLGSTCAQSSFIENLRGVGYRLIQPYNPPIH